MIRHVVVMTWKPGTTPDQVEAVRAGLATLPAQMTGLTGYAFGPDAGVSQGTADFAVVADFDSRESYLAYRDHPAHREIIERTLNPIVAERRSVQFES
ncbi:MAG TPA: Dabb family protein [Streptosporangiaceae bacterium]